MCKGIALQPLAEALQPLTELIGSVRQELPSMPFLVPGVGTQGGDLAAVLEAGRNDRGVGLVINASRSVLYASSGDDYAAAAESAARDLANAMEIAPTL